MLLSSNSVLLDFALFNMSNGHCVSNGWVQNHFQAGKRVVLLWQSAAAAQKFYISPLIQWEDDSRNI